MRCGFLIGLLFTPLFAFAATSILGPLVPTCFEGGNDLCQVCNLVTLGDNVLKIFVVLSAFAATLMLAYAGFLYVTAAGNQHNLDEGKKIFWNALIGLILVLAAWLIIDLILRTFTNQPLNVFTNIQCVNVQPVTGGFTFTPVPGSSPQQTNPGSGATGGGPTNTARPCAGQGDSCITGTTAYKPGISEGGLNGPDIDATGHQPCTVIDVKARSCSAVTVAVAQDSGIPIGTRYTWPALAIKLGLPIDTVFVANDHYRVGYGDGTFDVAVCGAHNGDCKNVSSPSYKNLPPPTKIGG